AYQSRVKKAFINVKGQGQIAASFMGGTVADALAQNGIELNENDEVFPSLYSKIKDGQIISVMPSRNVILAIGEETKELSTTKETIAELLSEQNIVIANGDYLIQNENTQITEGMKIAIVKSSKVLETVDVQIPFIETRRYVSNLNAGQTRVAQAGVKGIRREVYQVTYRGGVAVSRVLVSNNNLREPVEKVVEVGGAVATLASRDNVITLSVSVYQNYAYQKCVALGWNDTQFNALVKLWNKESSWNPNAHNKSSGAHGIPQALPGNKMGAGWQTDYKVQINWGISYIKSRYGNPVNAWNHSKKYGWY
ncbi:aggregation-promoting factor C-terminal-like domain-containing protein, partial [Treponema sp. R6D11]